MECVVAVGKNLGIGTCNGIPWYIGGDLKRFKSLTLNGIVVMGWNTFATLQYKPLVNRINIVLTTKRVVSDHSKTLFFMNLDNCIDYINSNNDKKTFIIGGEQIYKLFQPYITKIHLTHVEHEEKFDFNSHFFKIPSNFAITESSAYMYENEYKYRYITFEKFDTSYHLHDYEYLSLCEKVLKQGEDRVDRTGTGTVSIFGHQMKFDLRNSIPILTTKRVPWKSCIEELLWFIRGDTDATILNDKGVKIWNDNSSREFLDKVGLTHLDVGDCGANYSFQWRHFGAEYKNKTHDYSNYGTDQIAYIENLLKNDPYSRRIFMSAWNPCDLEKTVLPPCHVSVQFYVDKNNSLHCHMYQRSCDMFLGVPWNILSYSVLTYMLAFRNNLQPGFLTISTGDTHIYKDHLEQVKLQLSREHLCAPRLEINERVKEKEWKDITIDDFALIGYFPHESIKGKMSA